MRVVSWIVGSSGNVLVALWWCAAVGVAWALGAERWTLAVLAAPAVFALVAGVWFDDVW